MVEKSSKSAGGKAMSAAVTASEQARHMVIELGGPLQWSDTKDSWRVRIARKLHLNPRRVRAILSRERIKLSADEYLVIQTHYQHAFGALASLSSLASQADVRAGGGNGPRGGSPLREGERADGEAFTGAASTFRPRE